MPAATTSFRLRRAHRPATQSTVRRLVSFVSAGSLLVSFLGVLAPTPAAAVAAPAMLQAQGLTDTTAELLWSPVAGASSYDVYRGVTHVGVAVTGTLFDDTGLTPNTTYTYSVTATVSGTPSAATAAAPITTQAPADTSAPTWTGVSPALTAGSVTSNSVALSWSRATDNVGVVGYRILRGEGPTTPTAIATQDVGLMYKATSLKAATSYTFKVEALDAAGNESSLLSATVTTTAATDTAPAPPTSGTIFATPFSDSRIDVTWGTVAGAVGYQVFHSTTSGGPYTFAGEVDEPASPWFSDNGLAANTAYYYTIKALSSGGNLSIASAQKSAATLVGGTVKIVRGPYVQWATSTSARVAWWTNIASPSVVTYGTASPTGNTASDGDAVQEHVILLAPLSAGTSYQYAVGDGSVTATGALKTTAAPGSPFSFDAIGDYGSGSVGQKQNAAGIAADNADFLQTVGDNVYSQSADPDFTHTYSEMDGHFFKPMQPALSAKALWTANGNKEYYGNGAWFKVIWAPNNERWYSYDWGDAHVLVLDSTQPYASGTPQYAFAQADLNANQNGAWRIVVIQDPPYSSTSNSSSADAVRANLVPLFEAENVQLVLSGNSHNYERSYPLLGGVPNAGGVTYLVSGNGGNSFNPFTIPQPSWSAHRDATHYGHLHISVSPTAIDIQEINASDSSVLDSASILASSTYHALAGPVRIVDSRIALNLPTKLHSSVPQSFQVTAFNGDGIPAGATAITGNLTVTGQTAAGYVAITTTSQANPSTSTINFPVGDNRANGLTSPLGAGGKLWAVYKSSTSTATTQLVFDVTGYFSS